MNKEIMDRFYRIQRSWDFTFHGIAMNRVMIFEIYKLAQGYTLGTPNKWLRLACHTYDLSKLSFKKGNRILSTFGQQNRKDHKEVYDFVTSQLSGCIAYNDLNQLPRTRKIRIWLIFKVTLLSMISLRKNKDLNFKQKLRLSLSACVYCNSLVDLEKLSLEGVEKYLSMYHVDQLENMITQYMKLKKIPTYSLCEGVYIVDKDNLTIDAVNYTNFETDNLLVWGQYVIDQFTCEGIASSKMIVCGYPHQVTLESMKKNNHLKRCFVMLARRDFMEANVRLLQILCHFTNKYDFFLKAHPNSDFQAIKEIACNNRMTLLPQEMTINECMHSEQFDWAISVNTTAYYEALMRGVPCLRYNDRTYKLLPGVNDDFEDTNQLAMRVKYIEDNIETGKYQIEVNSLLKYVMGVGENNYNSVLLQ